MGKIKKEDIPIIKTAPHSLVQALCYKFHTGPMRAPLDNDPSVGRCGSTVIWWYFSLFLVQKAAAPSEGEIETWEEAFDSCSFRVSLQLVR